MIWPLPRIDYLPLKEVEDRRDVALVFSRAAWRAVQEQLVLPSIVWHGEPVEADNDHWDRIAQGLRGDVIYAVGGGLAVDCAKYLAAKHDKPLVCVPTAMSVDAFMTWASGIRRDGCVHYIETKPPEQMIVDLAVLAAAPPSLRAAGICDVLSIATGSWDWQFAEEQGKNPDGMQLIPYVYQNAQSILQGALDCAEAAGRGDPDGLKGLIVCLGMEVQLCNFIGHSRPEEGSEHYFAYSVENSMGKGLPHGDLVGPGILLMAEQQGQDTAPLHAALEACNIPLDRIPQATIDETLKTLPDYATQHNLPFGIVHTLNDGT